MVQTLEGAGGLERGAERPEPRRKKGSLKTQGS